jgi:hypothetical protein
MTSLLRGATAAAFTALLAGCGARASLAEGTSAASSTGGSSGGAPGSTTSSAGGAGGASACAALVWAGDAVQVPLGGVASLPRLLHTDVLEDTVVAEVASGGGVDVYAQRLGAWWQSWPPPMLGPGDLPNTGLSAGLGGHVVAAGGQGRLAIAHAFSTFDMAVSVVGADGTEVELFVFAWSGEGNPQALALARDNDGDLLVIWGADEAPAITLLQAAGSLLALGTAGCASAPVAVSAVGNGGGDGSFLVAVNGAGPHGTCIDPSPLGPPSVVQVLHVDSLGVVFAGDALPTGPVEDLQVVGRIGGGWLGYHVPDDGVFHVQQVDSQGHLGDSFTLPLASPLETSSIVAYGQGFARASAQRGDPEAPALVRLALLDGPLSAQVEATLPIGTTLEEAPALAVSDDGRQILLAYVARSSHGIPELWLRRADCAGGF